MARERREIPTSELEDELLKAQGGIWADVSTAGWFVLVFSLLYTGVISFTSNFWLAGITKVLIPIVVLLIVFMIATIIVALAIMDFVRGHGLSTRLAGSAIGSKYNEQLDKISASVDKRLGIPDPRQCGECGYINAKGNWKFCGKCGKQNDGGNK